MKKIFAILALCLSVNAFAQKENSIILTKGQKVTIVTVSDADIDMGMGATTKSSASSTNELIVLSDNDRNYNVSNQMAKLSISTPNENGEQKTLDSEKLEDRNSEAGKEIFKSINVVDTFVIDKISGAVSTLQKTSAENPGKDDANPISGMMDAGIGELSSSALLNNAFLIIPTGKKLGESWSDSTTDKKMTTKRIYSIKSIEKDIATITVVGTIVGNDETEINGITVPFSIDTKSTGETIVDMKTNLVSKNTNNADVTMTIDMMGQSLPLTSKSTSTTTYKY